MSGTAFTGAMMPYLKNTVGTTRKCTNAITPHDDEDDEDDEDIFEIWNVQCI